MFDLKVKYGYCSGYRYGQQARALRCHQTILWLLVEQSSP